MEYYFDEFENELFETNEELLFEEEKTDYDLPAMKCSACFNIFSINDCIDDYHCPFCFADLSQKIKSGKIYDSDSAQYISFLKQ